MGAVEASNSVAHQFILSTAVPHTRLLSLFLCLRFTLFFFFCPSPRFFFSFLGKSNFCLKDRVPGIRGS